MVSRRKPSEYYNKIYTQNGFKILTYYTEHLTFWTLGLILDFNFTGKLLINN